MNSPYLTPAELATRFRLHPFYVRMLILGVRSIERTTVKGVRRYRADHFEETRIGFPGFWLAGEVKPTCPDAIDVIEENARGRERQTLDPSLDSGCDVGASPRPCDHPARTGAI